MNRPSAPVLLSVIAVVISAIALPATGYVPWQFGPAPVAKPAQFKDMVKVDPADARASSLTRLRVLAQDSLQSLTDRELVVARDRAVELQQAWDAQREGLRGQLTGHWTGLDQTIRKAVARLSNGGTELFLSKAAMLDVLSALDAASAPTPVEVAPTAGAGTMAPGAAATLPTANAVAANDGTTRAQ